MIGLICPVFEYYVTIYSCYE